MPPRFGLMRMGVSFGFCGTTASQRRLPRSRDPFVPVTTVTGLVSPAIRARVLARSASPSTSPSATTGAPPSQTADALDTASTFAALAEALAGAALGAGAASSFFGHPVRRDAAIPIMIALVEVGRLL